MSLSDESFYVTGGTLRQDAACYVERNADRDLLQSLSRGEFCYVLTSRQMGKSSLMVRACTRLRQQKLNVVALDLTAIGQNLSPDQWYGGLAVSLGKQLRLEDELDEYWLSQERLSPVQRFFCAIREVALSARPGPHVVFIDEIDSVRSLPFSSDEFFAAIRECYNRRSEEPDYDRLTFCLLGVATPAELIRDTRITPFNIGRRIELTDFSPTEAAPLARGLGSDSGKAHAVLDRILYWTGGHPYLTQTLCRALAEERRDLSADAAEFTSALVDAICTKRFLSPRARERDDNLLFVRERILRSEADLGKLLRLYEQVHTGAQIPDDENDDRINQLRMAGIIEVQAGQLQVRNRIYATVFNEDWVHSQMPEAELEKWDGQRVRLSGTCNMGRASSNDLVLPDPKVSRRHALIQPQNQQQFWLLDLGSGNGTYINGKRVTQPTLLRSNDRIEIGPFRIVFRQARTPTSNLEETTNVGLTIINTPLEGG